MNDRSARKATGIGGGRRAFRTAALAFAMFAVMLWATVGVGAAGTAASVDRRPPGQPGAAVALPVTEALAGWTARLGFAEPQRTYVVTETDDPIGGLCDSAHCTLRAAIRMANQNPGRDTINFRLPANRPIALKYDPLPEITDPVVIDGTSQPGFPQSWVQIDGQETPPESDGLYIKAGNSVVKALVLYNFDIGIILQGNGGNVIEGNRLGTSAAGDRALGNRGDGILIENSPDNRIGGPDRPGESCSGPCNLISGNLVNGIEIRGDGARGNLVVGNFIGANVDGTRAMGNTSGIYLHRGGTGNIIGGTDHTAGKCDRACNLVAGNEHAGATVDDSATNGNQFLGNFIGTHIGGAGPLGNGWSGVSISDGTGNVVGGSAAGMGNVISGNGIDGVYIGGSLAGDNKVQGNLIGTDSNGIRAVSNLRLGIFISSTLRTQVGGATAGERNVVSGNASYGVFIAGFIGGTPAQDIVVQGNFIGTDGSGSAALGNGRTGVYAYGAHGLSIGGSAAGEGNVISGNERYGVTIEGGESVANKVLGNYIGTDRMGSVAIGNLSGGVQISATLGAQVGGPTVGERNVISGNEWYGVLVQGNAATGNTVVGNYIGTDRTGKVALGNKRTGVFVYQAPGNIIGGSAPGEGNVISGNGRRGVEISFAGAEDNRVQGNLIGTDSTGMQALGNAGAGVLIGGTSGNLIGGLAAGERNVISANDDGIYLSVANSNTVQGNFIGTDTSGSNDLGNLKNGIVITNSNRSLIGGPDPRAANTIAYNHSTGVRVLSGVGDTIRGNAIHANLGLGIDLIPEGPNSNDPLDQDDGPNGLQNFPVLEAVTATSARGTLRSTPNTRFILEFYANAGCDPSGYGEGELFLTSTEVTTDGNGNASFAVEFASPGPARPGLTVTATDASGNTSEFAACMGPSGPTPTPSPNPTAVPGSPHRIYLPLTVNKFTLSEEPPQASTATRAVASPPPAVSSATPTAPDPTGVPPPVASASPSPTVDVLATAVAATLTALAPSPTASPTFDALGTAVGATLTAMVPTATSTPTASHTPDVFATAIAATLTARAPTATGTPLPLLTATPIPVATATPNAADITVDDIRTTGADPERWRMIFIAGDAVQLRLQVTNTGNAPTDVDFTFEVVSRSGARVDELSWSGPLYVPVGSSWQSIQRQVPAGLVSGPYAYNGSVTYGGQTSGLSSELIIAAAEVLTDDFGSPASGWPMSETADTASDYIGGEYRIRIKSSDYTLWTISRKMPTVADFAAEADARMPGFNPGALALLFGWSASGSNFFIYEVTRDGTFALYRRNLGGWLTVSAPATSRYLGSGDKTNHLMVVRQRNKVTLYANGHELSTVTGVTVPSGKLGLYAWGKLAVFEARFDNYRAYGLESQ